MTNNPRINLPYRVMGLFWLLVGLAAGCFILWRADGYDTRVLLPLGVCSLLIVCGYRLMRERRWARLCCGVIVSLVTLWLLDMIAMLLFHYDFDLPLYLAGAGVLAGGFTLIILVFGKGSLTGPGQGS